MGSDAEKQSGGKDVAGAPRLIFYTTDGCGLCEVALDQILGMPLLAGLRMDVIDVALDDDLVARYGATLPVLVFGDEELHAPFDAAKVEQWIYDSRL